MVNKTCQKKIFKIVLPLVITLFLYTWSTTSSYAAITIPPQSRPTLMETFDSYITQTLSSFERSVVSFIAGAFSFHKSQSHPLVQTHFTSSVLAATDTVSQIQPPLRRTLSQESLTLTNLPTSVVNLLHNSSFEEQSNGAPRDWNYQLDSNTSNTFISPEGNRSGVYGLKFVGGGTGNFGISQPNVKTIPGRTYTFSLYIKETNVPTLTILRFGFWNEYTNQEGQMKEVSLPITSDWTRYSFTITTPGVLTDPKNEFPLLEVEKLTTGAVYLDDLSLTEGSIPVVYNTNAAYNTSYGIGDGSLIFTPEADIYPAYPGEGQLGNSTNQFESLTLTNASIDTNGNFLFKGG